MPEAEKDSPRRVVGESASSQRKLDGGKVSAIRKALKKGELLQKEIAYDFGITQQAVSLIKHGRRWSRAN